MTAQTNWAAGYLSRRDGLIPGTQRAQYSLTDLAARGLLQRAQVNRMLMDSALLNFTWHLIWADESPTPDADLPRCVAGADGYVVFIHGWTGSNAIWEHLPSLVVQRNPRLVSLVVDHNGFGETPFATEMPDMGHCGPLAAMRAVERWLDLLQVRRQPGDPRPRVVNFVGHSMGGAALFFLQENQWRLAEQTRMALAPALLLHDEMHRAFYTTLGLGIGLVGRIRALQVIDHVVSPSVLETLAEGATPEVKAEHARIYEVTPKSVTARTFAAMGLIEDHPVPHAWDYFRVILGHRDRLVGLMPMLALLEELEFNSDQVRVVMGTHYLFSVGMDMERWHSQNRAIVLHDILHLHNEALQRQRTG
jgi:pimeloyl-ACP methyl ester carboxylesterase